MTNLKVINPYRHWKAQAQLHHKSWKARNDERFGEIVVTVDKFAFFVHQFLFGDLKKQQLCQELKNIASLDVIRLIYPLIGILLKIPHEIIDDLKSLSKKWKYIWNHVHLISPNSHLDNLKVWVIKLGGSF